MSDYLWDKSGAPDPEIERLEKLLEPYRYARREPRRPRMGRSMMALAIAASLVMVTAAVWFATRPRGPAWQVVALQGRPGAQKLTQGGVVETDASSRARLEMDTFGHVEVEPNTRLKLLVTKKDEQRLALTRGKIQVEIWAPPRQFFVNTPSAVAVDLGCSYTLQVDGNGVGTVNVTFGWVAFEDHGRESFIPAAAVCKTRPAKGPGTPYYEDSPAALKTAVDRFDEGETGVLETILAAARPRDAFTVWHLLRRVPVADRGEVFDRLSQLVQLPPDVTREMVLRGDARAIDRLWDALGLGDTEWWRTWKR